MGKNFKRITKPSQLVGGQMYIRILINPVGDVMLETLTILGKAFKYRGKYDSKFEPLKYQVKLRYSGPCNFERRVYFSDTAQYYRQDAPATKTGALYRFNNELLTKLKGMLDDRRSILELIKGERLNNPEFVERSLYWQQNAFNNQSDVLGKTSYHQDLNWERNIDDKTDHRTW